MVVDEIDRDAGEEVSEAVVVEKMDVDVIFSVNKALSEAWYHIGTPSPVINKGLVAGNVMVAVKGIVGEKLPSASSVGPKYVIVVVPIKDEVQAWSSAWALYPLKEVNNGYLIIDIAYIRWTAEVCAGIRSQA